MRRLLLCLAIAACGNNGTSTPKDAPPGPGSDAAGGPDASCFTNPTTHNEIINACTSAQKIYKNSHPPLQNPDGSLPPLP